jgi:CreA protein
MLVSQRGYAFTSTAVLRSATFVLGVAKKPHGAVNGGRVGLPVVFLIGRLMPTLPGLVTGMSSRFPSLSRIRLKGLALFLLALTVPAASAFAADEPDLIFRRSTVFKWMSPNDKLATYGLDDPEVEGVACHFTVPEKGGFKGWLGLAEEVSDISLACRQVGPIKFKNKMEQGDDMFRQRRSLFFKKMQIVRGCDAKRNVLVYMVYSDRLIEGSPKNSTSTVPIMPWGPADANVQKCGEFFTQ